jgi:uncharacterized membrane protein
MQGGPKMAKQIYTSDPNFVFATKYTDYELDTNRHPEATIKLPGKKGYKLVFGKFTAKICNELAGNRAYCTALIMSGGKKFDGIKEISTNATAYTNISFDIGKTIETEEEVIFYLHLKSTSSTSKARVQSFTFEYEYVKIQQEEPPITGTTDYVISLEGTESQIYDALSLIKKALGENIKAIEVFTKKS